MELGIYPNLEIKPLQPGSEVVQPTTDATTVLIDYVVQCPELFRCERVDYKTIDHCNE